jgi:hypothetical protein
LFDDLADISEEISNRRVDLCQGKLHSPSVTSENVRDNRRRLSGIRPVQEDWRAKKMV